MDRDAFNGLEIEKQVEVFNKMLKRSSIRKVCSELKISKTTIRNRFKKRGYIFHSEENKYVKDQEIEVLEKEIKRNDQITPKDKQEKVSNINLTKEIYTDLLELIEIKEDLKAMASHWKEGGIHKTKALHINAFEGVLCVKSIKVYKEVLDQFNTFVKKHRELKQQDIINQALWEFLQKHS